MLHPDDVTDAVKVLENDGVTLWRKPDGSLLTTDANGHPPMPHNVRETFWQLPFEAQVSEIFRLVAEMEISSGKAAELFVYLGLAKREDMLFVKSTLMGLQPYYGYSLDETKEGLRKLGVAV
jgi:hypothetical protein